MNASKLRMTVAQLCRQPLHERRPELEQSMKASNGYEVRVSPQPKPLGPHISIHGPSGELVGGIHAGSIFVRRSALKNKDHIAQAAREFMSRHPESVYRHATFPGATSPVGRTASMRTVREDEHDLVCVDHVDIQEGRRLPHRRLIDLED